MLVGRFCIAVVTELHRQPGAAIFAMVATLCSGHTTQATCFKGFVTKGIKTSSTASTKLKSSCNLIGFMCLLTFVFGSVSPFGI